MRVTRRQLALAAGAALAAPGLVRSPLIRPARAEADPGITDPETSSSANSSRDTPRRGYAVRYVGDDARWDPRPGILETIPGPSVLPMPTVRGGPMDSEAFPVIAA